MNELSKDQLDEIRERNWEDKYDDLWASAMHQLTHEDRAALLQHAKALQAKLDVVERLHQHAKMNTQGIIYADELEAAIK